MFLPLPAPFYTVNTTRVFPPLVVFLPSIPRGPVARLLGYAGILPRPPLSRAARKTPATTRRVRLPETPLVAAVAVVPPRVPPPSLTDALSGEGAAAAGVVHRPTAASR